MKITADTHRQRQVRPTSWLAGVLLFLGARRRGDDIDSDEEQEDLENERALEERGGAGEDPRLCVPTMAATCGYP